MTSWFDTRYPLQNPAQFRRAFLRAMPAVAIPCFLYSVQLVVSAHTVSLSMNIAFNIESGGPRSTPVLCGAVSSSNDRSGHGRPGGGCCRAAAHCASTVHGHWPNCKTADPVHHALDRRMPHAEQQGQSTPASLQSLILANNILIPPKCPALMQSKPCTRSCYH